ncbi:MAG: hypothetical protein ACM34K_19580 [Bacillota bacterium]
MEEVYTQKNNEVITPSAANNTVTTGDWFLTMLITAIPLVGLIMLFVWAFGGGTNPSKQNWAKAALIWMLVSVVLGVLFFGAIFAAIFHNS